MTYRTISLITVTDCVVCAMVVLKIITHLPLNLLLLVSVNRHSLLCNSLSLHPQINYSVLYESTLLFVKAALHFFIISKVQIATR